MNAKNVENTFERLLSLGVIPIVNENDTVAIDELELEIGENDSLSAIVATIAKAELLIILSDIDGLFDNDPHKCEGACLIPVVTEITSILKKLLVVLEVSLVQVAWLQKLMLLKSLMKLELI